MKIQCADGILSTIATISKEGMTALQITSLNQSLADAKARKPPYRTPATIAEVQAVIDAQAATAQAKRDAETAQRTAWLNSLTDAELIDINERTMGANMLLPGDVRAEMIKRTLLPAPTLGSAEFSAYVAAKNRAEREGRSAEFEDGIN